MLHSLEAAAEQRVARQQQTIAELSRQLQEKEGQLDFVTKQMETYLDQGNFDQRNFDQIRLDQVRTHVCLVACLFACLPD